MIDRLDHVSFPAAVRMTGSSVLDEVVEQAYPLHGSAPVLLALLAGGLSIAEAAEVVAAEAGAPGPVVERDLLRLAEMLNRAGLVNVVPYGRFGSLRRDIQALLTGVATHQWHGRMRRVELDFGSTGVLAKDLGLAVLGTKAWLWVALFVVGLQANAASGSQAMVLWVLAEAGVIGSIYMHELGHLLALKGLHLRGYLIVNAFKLGVISQRGSRPSLVAMAGAVGAVAVGMFVLGAAYLLASEPLAALGLPFAFHALSLTIVAPDGRHLFSEA